METYWKSDLICEMGEAKSGWRWDGSHGARAAVGHVRIERWRGTDRAGELMRCVTLFSKPLWRLEEGEFSELSDCVTRELVGMIGTVTGGRRKEAPLSVLVVGLGNRALTPDAVGPEVARRIAVSMPTEEGKDSEPRVAAFVPDVVGNTGIETAELIRGAVDRLHPHVILAVDALTARSPARLASVIQLSDGGIAPGSGLGKHRTALDRQTLGVPVLALGVPTVVSSSAWLAEALEACEIRSVNDPLRSILETGRGFFVTPKEIDLILHSAALLLSDAINQAVGTV